MLYVVATPIGNLADITLRAIRVLEEVDFIVAEDPTHTGKLLKHLGIIKPYVKHHQQSRAEETQRIVKRLAAGETAALVTDAGTPGIADPAGELVAEARRAGIKIVPIPGPSAVTALLSVAGMPTDSYMFIGFLPKKRGRSTLLQEMADIDMPMVIFESPNRMAKTMRELAAVLGGDRTIVIGRELTKLHEEVMVTTLSLAADKYEKAIPKGEFVVVVGGN